MFCPATPRNHGACVPNPAAPELADPVKPVQKLLADRLTDMAILGREHAPSRRTTGAERSDRRGATAGVGSTTK